MTDHDLDNLLADLNTNVPDMTDAAFAAGRARLQGVVDTGSVVSTPTPDPVVVPLLRNTPLRSPPRRARYLVAAAAAVLAIGAGAVLVQDTEPTGPAAVAGTATWTPEQLAEWAAGLADNPPPFGPGQFRYERTHEWSSAPWNNEPGLFYEFTRDVETWVPHDYRDEWLQRLGPQTVVRVEGTEKTTEPPQAGWDLREPCGNLRELPPIEEPERTEPCDGNGWFWAASPEFYRSLTGDPQKLYDAIRKQVTSEFRGNDLDFLGKADQLLEPNTPNDFKATLFEAMSRMPGLVVLDDVMTADGRNGIGLRFTDTTPWVLDGFATQWILDRETGDLLETKVTGPGPANESIVTNTYGVTDQAGVPPAQ